MDNVKLGNAVEYDVELHSIYAAYIGQFESKGWDWWDTSWAGYFNSFSDFLSFGWEVMIVVDSVTGRGHLAVKREQIALFAKMIKTRFGETLDKDPPTSLPLNPVPTRALPFRRLTTISDLTSYRKLAQTIPAAEFHYLRARVKAGDVDVIEQLFRAGSVSGSGETSEITNAGIKDNGEGYTWACVKTTWWEKGGGPQGFIPGQGKLQPKAGTKGLVLEIGTAVLRCSHLKAVGVWPPIPIENYRKQHLISEEWVDKRTNSSPPSYPRAYAWGKSRYIPERSVEKILDATLGALASQENDNNANTLILLTIGDMQPLPIPSSTTIPSNILHLDLLALEFSMLRRAQENGGHNAPDRRIPLTSLRSLLQTLQIPVPSHIPLGNAGNDAFYTLLAFQKLVMADTRLPDQLFAHVEHPAYGPTPASYQMQFNSLPSRHSMAFSSQLNIPQFSPQAPPPQTLKPNHHSRHGSGSGSSAPLQAPDYFARPANGRLSSSPSSYVPPPTARSRNPTEGEYSRQRPASVHDPSVIGQRRQESNSPMSGTPPERISGGVRVKPMLRSQTVFWDDVEYADAVQSDPQRNERPTRWDRDERSGQDSNRLSAIHHSASGNGGRSRSAGNLPPSAMRNGSANAPGQTGSSSRNISWERIQASGGLEVASGGSGSASTSTGDGTTNNRKKGGSSTNSPLGSGSTTNLKVEKEKDKDKKKGRSGGEEPKGKLKSEKSVKDIAGALARFWVG